MPIVLMSGYDRSGEAESACDEGICDHVMSKPVEPGQLAAMLHAMMKDTRILTYGYPSPHPM